VCIYVYTYKHIDTSIPLIVANPRQDMRVYVCIYIYVYTFENLYEYPYMCIRMYACICMHMCIHIPLFVAMTRYVCIYRNSYMHIYRYSYTYVRMHIHEYVYTYVCMHIYTYMYIRVYPCMYRHICIYILLIVAVLSQGPAASFRAPNSPTTPPLSRLPPAPPPCVTIMNESGHTCEWETSHKLMSFHDWVHVC